MRFYIVILLLFSTAGLLKAQQVEPGGHEHWVTATVVNGDTVPLVYMDILNVFGDRQFKNKRERKKYNRLKHNVKTVYPYAKLAGELLRKYEDSLAAVESRREEKRFYKKVEEELRAEYENELKDLTITQGRILIKLIDRETGHTSYNIVSELRSVFTAFFWQSIARLFGNDLKDRYDPDGTDKEIEQIVLALESGIDLDEN